MLRYVDGNLFDSKADALAQGCNTQGKMGAGIAKEFRERFPDMYTDYKKRCEEGRFQPGTGYMFEHPEKPHIINLATQDREGARLLYVESALEWLKNSYDELGIESIAIPRIASGLGGMEWDVVHSSLKKKLSESPLVIEIWNL